MLATTGPGTCTRCHGQVLMVRNIETGKLVRLEPVPSEDGRWKVEHAPGGGVLVATYHPETRGGHRGHDLPCAQGLAPRRLVLGTWTEGSTPRPAHVDGRAPLPAPRIGVLTGEVVG